MRRGVALGPEVVLCRNDSPSEETLPDSIDGDAGGERILSVDQPACEVESGRRRLRALDGREDSGGTGRDERAVVEEIPPPMNVCRTSILSLL